ncbi:MAG: hypothetical protein Q7R45_07985, partial [Sulfuricaulis sp.]|nr:hypothetical protein [Sulfuricaulis sp.]
GQIDPAMLGQLRTPEMQNTGMQMFLQQMQRENAPPERVDLGDRIGLVKNGQIVGYLPKGATPDATMREGGANARHAAPSGGAILGAQTSVRGQDLTNAASLRSNQIAAGNLGVAQGNLAQTRVRDAATDARATAAAQAGRIPPGYRTTAAGSLEAIPGGPADEKEAKKTSEVSKAVDMYVAARDGLLTGLEGSTTGPVMGRIPAVTTGQQVAEGGVAAMAPVLKQLFRVSGEGVFTDRDQALLLDMVPKRSDQPEARAEKMANIDRIVSAKLGQPVPQRVGGAQAVKIAGDSEYNALPSGARYIGPDGVERVK